eukprot:238500-Amphidinium_carterae.1
MGGRVGCSTVVFYEQLCFRIAAGPKRPSGGPTTARIILGHVVLQLGGTRSTTGGFYRCEPATLQER